MDQGRDPIAVGQTAYDERLSRLGEVMEVLGTLVALRPLGGGREWNAERRHVRPATAMEKMRPGVAE
ncbi:hypothetical protein AB0M29_22680 [Streptomyces sp. NPDC051976]|uniref:hypothetical protein n=1 Tax=Streptomyces sp. NPDC051976 TaxID=3154947 RepID=UPI003426E902